MIHRLSIIASGGVFAGGLLAFAHTISKKKAISERYTIKTASRLLQNDIACPADRGGSPTMRTNPGNKMTKRTSRQRTTFFFFFPKHLPAKHRVFVKGEG